MKKRFIVPGCVFSAIFLFGSVSSGTTFQESGMAEIEIAASNPAKAENVAIGDDSVIWLAADESLVSESCRLVAGPVSLYFRPDGDGNTEDAFLCSCDSESPTGISMEIGSDELIPVWISDGVLSVATEDWGASACMDCGSVSAVQIIGSSICDVRAYVPEECTVSDWTSGVLPSSDEARGIMEGDNFASGKDSSACSGSGERVKSTANDSDSTAEERTDTNEDSLKVIPVNADYHYSAK